MFVGWYQCYHHVWHYQGRNIYICFLNWGKNITWRWSLIHPYHTSISQYFLVTAGKKYHLFSATADRSNSDRGMKENCFCSPSLNNFDCFWFSPVVEHCNSTRHCCPFQSPSTSTKLLFFKENIKGLQTQNLISGRAKSIEPLFHTQCINISYTVQYYISWETIIVLSPRRSSANIKTHTRFARIKTHTFTTS